MVQILVCPIPHCGASYLNQISKFGNLLYHIIRNKIFEHPENFMVIENLQEDVDKLTLENENLKNVAKFQPSKLIKHELENINLYHELEIANENVSQNQLENNNSYHELKTGNVDSLQNQLLSTPPPITHNLYCDLFSVFNNCENSI